LIFWLKAKKTKKYVVIELKKGRSSDVVVGQIPRYIGWINEKVAGRRGVKGVIVAMEDGEELR
jgi:restriction system protein